MSRAILARLVRGCICRAVLVACCSHVVRGFDRRFKDRAESNRASRRVHVETHCGIMVTNDGNDNHRPRSGMQPRGP